MKPLLDNAARQLVEAFVGCLVIPVRPDLDADSVPPPLETEVASDVYWSRLATHSIAVLLGPRSGGLFAIRFGDERRLAEFLANNPESRSTLITSHAGCPVVWHRSVTPHQAPLHLPGITVRMSGNVMVYERCGLHRSDRIIQVGTPAPINPEDLDWGQDSIGAVDVWLTRVFEGDLFREDTQGGLIPNRAVWRAYLVRRLRSHLAFDKLERRFYFRNATDDWQPFAEDAIRPWIRELIMTAPSGTAWAKAKLNDKWLDRLARQLKLLLPVGSMVLQARMRAFARDCLRAERGSDITVGELYEAFAAWCQDNELLAIPEEVFKQHIAAVLRVEPWFRPKSKSVVRGSGHQNGFRSLAFRKPIVHATSIQHFDGNGAVGVVGTHV